MMNELLTCIKLVKMYAWEKSFAKAIACKLKIKSIFLFLNQIICCGYSK